MLHINIYGGFGNRLPAMAFVILISKIYNVPYQLYWSYDGAGIYENIFNNRKDIININKWNIDKQIKKEEFFNKLKLNEDIYLSLCYPINHDNFDSLCSIIQSYKFNEEIKVNYEYTNSIGIHLRCNHPNISVQQIIKKLYKEIELFIDKNEKFFITTDNEKIKNDLIKKYGENRFYTYKETYYNRDRNILSDQHAIRDLLTYSNCKKCIGCSGSTFSMYPRYFNRKYILL